MSLGISPTSNSIPDNIASVSNTTKQTLYSLYLLHKELSQMDNENIVWVNLKFECIEINFTSHTFWQSLDTD